MQWTKKDWVKVYGVWMDQIEPSPLSAGLHAAFRSTTPGHWAIAVVIKNKIAYLDNGGQGHYENGVSIFTLDGRCPPLHPLGVQNPDNP